MVLIGVVPDQTMACFEHHTFLCSECRDTERRLVFVKNGREVEVAPSDYAENVLIDIAPPTVPASAEEEHGLAALGPFSRVLERIRGY
jgi:hypothetical protein